MFFSINLQEVKGRDVFDTPTVKAFYNNELTFKKDQWVIITCKAHKKLTGKLALVVGYTPDDFYQVLYLEETLKQYLSTGKYFMCDNYFGVSQLSSTNLQYIL